MELRDPQFTSQFFVKFQRSSFKIQPLMLFSCLLKNEGILKFRTGIRLI